MTTTAPAIATFAPAPPTSALGYLDRALKTLAPLGLYHSGNDQMAPIAALVQELTVLDEAKSIVVARTLAHNTTFNEAVRSQVADMRIAARHEQLSSLWDTVISDMTTLGQRAEQPKQSLGDKASFMWMKLSRGTVHKRFDKIRTLYTDVSADTKDQLDREAAILSAYLDYRGAVKESEIATAQMLKLQSVRLYDAKVALAMAQKAVDTEQEPEAKAKAQLARDEAQRSYDAENSRFDTVKMLSESLTVEYATSEAVMADLAQSREVKASVYKRSLTFFPAVNTILSGLSANLTSKQGLVESARAIDATTSGINRGLEALAQSGRDVKLQALRTAHGVTIKADSVRALVDSIIAFKTESIKLVDEQRRLATVEAAQIADIVEKGKETLVRITAAAETISAITTT